MAKPATKALLTMLSLMATLVAALMGCDLFKLIDEGEYNFQTKGPPAYFYESFEKNDGATSTEHYFSREAAKDVNRPVVSKTWASEGSWSMKVPNRGILFWTLDVQESGYLSLKLYSDDSGRGSWNAYCPEAGYERTEELKPATDGKPVTSSLFLHRGKNDIHLYCKGGTFYIDELQFRPTLDGATPSDNCVVTSTPILLDWPDDEEGFPYRLQVSYSEDFSSPLLDVRGLIASEYSLAGLPAGRCYFWRILTAGAAPAEDWSLPYHFYLAALPRDDSFETALHGPSCLNAWFGTGPVSPHIVDTDSFMGTYSLRLDQSDAISTDTFIETAVTLDTAKVLRYAYKIAATQGVNGTPVYLRFRRQSGEGIDQVTKEEIPLSQTNGRWVSAAELLPAGTHQLRWTFERSASGDSPGSYALLDALRFEDPPAFVGDDFEPTGIDGQTSFAWGCQGWNPALLSEDGGFNNSHCAIIPKTGTMTGKEGIYPSGLKLVGDIGEQPAVLAFKAKGHTESIYINRYQVSSQSNYEASVWGERYYLLNDSGTQEVYVFNQSATSDLRIDDARLIPFFRLGEAVFTEEFESGSLGGQYYYDETCPPILDSRVPHSGAYCLRLQKYDNRRETLFAYPLIVGDRDYKVTFWMRSEGTRKPGDCLYVYRNLQIPLAGGDCSSEWTRFSFVLPKGAYACWPLTFTLKYQEGGDYSVYIDDIAIEPI